ncbi:uncharacterized protein G2W53_013865 [Senna tora]|uniref:Putative plant transposon protein domain-containing protein n=1 Tax=Senna tora TaxID=362788 RepID=A0A834WR25_9FABA|nr:uncharacterized protein G2W53_013865 [Senna tora]
MPRGKKNKVIELSPPQIRKAMRRRVIESPPSLPPRIFTPPSSPKGETTKIIEVPELAEEDTRAVEDYATPSAEGLQSSISRLTVQATTFEIKPATIQLLQSMGTFGGVVNEDPNRHILNFLEICDTNRQNGVSDEARKARFDDMRFATALAEQRYTKLFSHSATGIHERGLSLDPEGHPNLDQAMSETMDAFSWVDFIKASSMAGRLSIVHEFYANFSSQDNGKVLMQGKRVPISCEAIRAFYKLPPVYVGVHYAYAASTALPEEQIPFDDIGVTLRLNEEIGSIQWEKDSQGNPKHLSLTKVSACAWAWLYFNFSSLIPFSHLSKITKDRAFLVITSSKDSPSMPLRSS